MPMKLGLGLGLSRRAVASGGGGNVAPVITGVPTISGTPEVGEVLTASPASVTGTPSPTRTWQWVRDGVDIGGETASSYTVLSGDVGLDISVRQIETNVAGSDDAISGGVTIRIDPATLNPTTWFRPNDLTTIYQEHFGVTAANTAGQTVGLINSQGSLGSELVTNGTFDSDVTGWTPFGSTSITWNSGQMRVTVNSGNISRQIVTVATGRAYQVLWDGVNVTSTQARLALGTSTPNSAYNFYDGSGTGRRAVVWNTSSTSLHVQATPQPNTNGLIADYDNISVRLLPGYSAFQTTAGSRPTLRQSGNGVYYLEDDGGDSISWQAPAGTYTVAYVNASGVVTILTSQSLSGATDMLLDAALVEYIAISGSLTTAQTAGLTAYLEFIANP